MNDDGRPLIVLIGICLLVTVGAVALGLLLTGCADPGHEFIQRCEQEGMVELLRDGYRKSEARTILWYECRWEWDEMKEKR